MARRAAKHSEAMQHAVVSVGSHEDHEGEAKESRSTCINLTLLLQSLILHAAGHRSHLVRPKPPSPH